MLFPFQVMEELVSYPVVIVGKAGYTQDMSQVHHMDIIITRHNNSFKNNYSENWSNCNILGHFLKGKYQIFDIYTIHPSPQISSVKPFTATCIAFSKSSSTFWTAFYAIILLSQQISYQIPFSFYLNFCIFCMCVLSSHCCHSSFLVQQGIIQAGVRQVFWTLVALSCNSVRSSFLELGLTIMHCSIYMDLSSVKQSAWLRTDIAGQLLSLLHLKLTFSLCNGAWGLRIWF